MCEDSKSQQDSIEVQATIDSQGDPLEFAIEPEDEAQDFTKSNTRKQSIQEGFISSNKEYMQIFDKQEPDIVKQISHRSTTEKEDFKVEEVEVVVKEELDDKTRSTNEALHDLKRFIEQDVIDGDERSEEEIERPRGVGFKGQPSEQFN